MIYSKPIGLYLRNFLVNLLAIPCPAVPGFPTARFGDRDSPLEAGEVILMCVLFICRNSAFNSSFPAVFRNSLYNSIVPCLEPSSFSIPLSNISNFGLFWTVSRPPGGNGSELFLE